MKAVVAQGPNEFQSLSLSPMFLDADLYSSTPLKTSWFFFFALKSLNNFCRFLHVWTRRSRRLHNFLFCISRYFCFWSAKSHEPCLSLFPKVSFSPNFHTHAFFELCVELNGTSKDVFQTNSFLSAVNRKTQT